MSCLFVFQDSYLMREDALWLPAALSSQGSGAQVISSQDFALERVVCSFPEHEPVVFVGSISFCRQMSKRHVVRPGAYYSDSRFRCSAYLPDLPVALLLNARPVFVPAGLLRASFGHYFDLLGGNQLFIRPDSGAKVFSGLVVSRSEFDQEMSSLDQLSGITDHTMVLISPAKPIESEYRFVIVQGQVVTGSRYMLNGQLDKSSDVDDRCLTLAQEIASLPSQVDLAYTCDICISLGEAKVIELNAFSTSGLYACDRLAAFQAVARVAALEHSGDLSLE